MNVSELLAELVDLRVKARQAEDFVRPNAEPGHVYYIRHTDGTLYRKEAEPEPRNHEVGDLETIVRLAEAFCESEDVVVWYSRQEVVCILDDDTRRDIATLCLQRSPQFDELARSLNPMPSFARANFLHFLRYVLYPGVPTYLIDLIANYDAATSEPLPTHVTITVPPFLGIFPEKVFPVKCYLSHDAQEDRWGLAPFPGEVEHVYRQAEQALHDYLEYHLRDSDVEIYCGMP